jgi:hypothetical protein
MPERGKWSPALRSWVADLPVVLQFLLIVAVSLAASGLVDLRPNMLGAAVVAGVCFTAFSLVTSRRALRWQANVLAVVLSLSLVLAAVRFLPDPAPNPPMDLLGEAGFDRITYSWTASRDDPKVKEYQLYCDGKLVYVGKQRAAVHSGVKPGDTVDCYVIAIGDNGFVSRAAATSVKVPIKSLTLGVPTQLTAATVDVRAVSLVWMPQGDEQATFWILRDGRKIGEANGPKYTDASVLPDTSYVFSVRAASVSKSEQSEDSAPATVHTLPETPSAIEQPKPMPPGAPEALHATERTTTSIALAWNAPRTGGKAMRYEVLRNGAVVGSTGTTAYTDAGRKAGTTYSYAVRALGSSGLASPITSPLAVSTEPPAVEASGVETMYANGSVNLDPGYDQYDLWLSDDGLYLTGQYNARLGFISPASPEAYESCNGANLVSSLDIADLKNGSKICVMSSEGRRGLLKVIVEMTASNNFLRFTIVVWAKA